MSKDDKYYHMIQQYGEDILTSANMAVAMTYMHHGSISVFDHSVSVAILCLKIARYFHLKTNEVALVRGALLHDYYLYDWHIKDNNHKWHGFIHAKRALENAERDFILSDIERNMIVSHMFPLNIRILRYRESVILTIADKICATWEILSTYKKKRRDGIDRSL